MKKPRLPLLAFATLLGLSAMAGPSATAQNYAWYSHSTTPRPQRTYYRNYRYHVNSHYPKYIGGFHARHYQELGVPPGDIGLRGNGISWTPW